MIGRQIMVIIRFLFIYNQTIRVYNCFVYHNDQTCQCCKKSGHKVMSPECPNYTDIDNIVFRSSDHVFSNCYSCNIKVNNEEFVSTECAYQWLKYIILNRPEVAEKVEKCYHVKSSETNCKGY